MENKISLDDLEKIKNILNIEAEESCKDESFTIIEGILPFFIGRSVSISSISIGYKKKYPKSVKIEFKIYKDKETEENLKNISKKYYLLQNILKDLNSNSKVLYKQLTTKIWK